MSESKGEEGGGGMSCRAAVQDLDSICLSEHIMAMDWEVEFDPAFDPEFDALPTAVQDELLVQAGFWRLSDRFWVVRGWTR